MIAFKPGNVALAQRIFDGENNPLDLTGLTVQQRYIYQYFLHHKGEGTGRPIPVPTYAGRADKIHKFFTALNRLEERGLIVVDRRASNYKEWTISGPR